MRKNVVLGLVAVVVIAAAVVGVVLTKNHKSSGGTNSQTNMTDMNSSSNSSKSSNNKPAATSSVTIQNFAFSPASITVKAGTTVTWTNSDNTAHTVTETDGKTGPNSGTLTPGKKYTFTYTTAGTYQYHCEFHGDMTGTVTVTQ